MLSEYAAKRLLIGEGYSGYTVNAKTNLSDLVLPVDLYVVKVDDGTKKRNKKGLVKLNLNARAAINQAKKFLEKGYQRVLVEPVIKHELEDEQYISCTLVRAGVSVLYSEEGGNEIESSRESVSVEVINRADFFTRKTPEFNGVPSFILELIVSTMRKFHISFVEINPFVLTDDSRFALLDAAVELDSSKLHTLPEWVSMQVQKPLSLPEEVTVTKLDEQSNASFSLTVFDKDAAIFTLLSGGGASLVVLDTLVDIGLQTEVANYGEYSGGPTRGETKIYTKAILNLLFASKAPRKVLVIAGGVANFTDVTTTFLGIIDACTAHLEEFRNQSIQVRARRGGPRQVEGLARLTAFFTDNGIQAEVSGSEISLPQIATDVKIFLEK